MDLANLDHLAVNNKAPFCLSSTIVKALFVTITVILLIATKSTIYPLMIFCMLIATMMANKVPLLKVLPLLFYPFFFTGLFTLISGLPLNQSLWLISKSCAIALSLIFFITTTPLYNLFAIMQKILPTLFVDGLFFTYRSFFIFHNLFSNLFTVLKLKGGFNRKRMIPNMKNMGALVAITFIKALDSAHNMADAMRVRGYSCGTLKETESFKVSVWDSYPIGLTIIFILSYLWV
ncbi:energy-coupling factor transporter transmembrane component T [Proteinivorax tanatarense]|uniref:energy-coupling factor transporter transmembrane component T n=1 Tax=Proteinivorax tanatarense TaxID=1260629 RepID=UPI0033138BDC